MTVITCVMESMETVKMFAFCSCLRFCKVELNFYELEILAERYPIPSDGSLDSD